MLIHAFASSEAFAAPTLLLIPLTHRTLGVMLTLNPIISHLPKLLDFEELPNYYERAVA